MRLWQRAAGALKDRKSILAATIAGWTPLRNPDLEAAVIKATSHDDSRIDYRNAQRVFSWIRMSPVYLRPFLRSLSARLEKSRSWVVALKSLMLLNGVFCCGVPAVATIGRLPFDLSNFNAGPAKLWGVTVFIRDYYQFLDRKSALMCLETSEERPVMEELLWLQKMQGLLDLLLRIRPQRDGSMIRILLLEAMDCVIVEIFDVYSRLCGGIARVLMRICAAGKAEASMALKLLQKAGVQGEELTSFFSHCRAIGVMNASECPAVERVPEEDIQELERIINGFYERTDSDSNGKLQTIITKEWELFDDDPFAAALVPTALPYCNHRDLPDLISFY